MKNLKVNDNKIEFEADGRIIRGEFYYINNKTYFKSKTSLELGIIRKYKEDILFLLRSNYLGSGK